MLGFRVELWGIVVVVVKWAACLAFTGQVELPKLVSTDPS